MEQQKFIYQFVDEDYSDYNNDDIKYIETDKECSHLISWCVDEIWHNRDNKEYLADIVEEYNKDDDELTIGNNIYLIPETFGELINFIFDYLESKGINASYYCPKIDGTFEI